MVSPPGHLLGGRASLLRLLSDHGEAVEADLARFYHLRLADLTCGLLTWRRLGVLVRHLPTDGALARALHGEAVRWSTADHLMATTVDLLASANWQRGGGKGKRPRRLPRPGSSACKKHGRTAKSPQETASYLASFSPLEVTDGD